jgi:hypothetical protein
MISQEYSVRMWIAASEVIILENKVPENKDFFHFLVSRADIERYNTIRIKLHVSVNICRDEIVHIFREIDKRMLRISVEY